MNINHPFYNIDMDTSLYPDNKPKTKTAYPRITGKPHYIVRNKKTNCYYYSSSRLSDCRRQIKKYYAEPEKYFIVKVL